MTNDQIVRSKRTVHRNPIPEEYGIVLESADHKPLEDAEDIWDVLYAGTDTVSEQKENKKTFRKNVSDEKKLSKTSPVFSSNRLKVFLLCMLIFGLVSCGLNLIRAKRPIESWEDVIQASKNGTYDQKLRIGDTMTLDLGEEGTITMELVAKDEDELADGSGKAHMTWISLEALNTTHRMNPTYDGHESTGTDGGWEMCEMRTYLQDDIMPLLPQELQEAVKKVKKISLTTDTNDDNAGQFFESETVDNLWIPSVREVLGRKEESGACYKEYYLDSNVRQKHKPDESDPLPWWLRSSHIYGFSYIGVDGTHNNTGAAHEGGVVIGFCL